MATNEGEAVLEVQFTLDKRDHLAFLRAYSRYMPAGKKNRRSWTLGILLAFVLVSTIALVTEISDIRQVGTSGVIRELGAFLGFSLVTLAGIYGYIRLIRFFATRSQLRRVFGSPRGRRTHCTPTSLRISPQALHFESEYLSSRIAWCIIEAVINTPDYFLLCRHLR